MPSLTFPTVTCLRMPERAALPDIVRGAAEAGFGRVGLDGFTLAAFDGDPAPLLREYGLSCSDVGILRIGEPGETLRSADALADLGQRLGARFCVTAFDTLDTELAATCAERLSRAGMRLAVFAGPVAMEVLNPRFRALPPAEQARAARAAARAVWPALDEGVHS